MKIKNIINLCILDIMDYYSKYVKYKTKYNNLKTIKMEEINGGVRKSWDKMVKERKQELKNLKTTKSYVSRNKLSDRNRIYYIHDNGGRPFKVVCNKDGIFIYRNSSSENKDDQEETEPILKIKKFQGYWNGFDSSPYKMNGNSILVQVTKSKYIYIGSEIYDFSTDDEIIDYVSPVGNSDVPYPVSYGTDNVYFMLDKKFIKRDDLETPITIANAEDLYGEFYGHIGSKGGKHKK